MQYIIYIMYTDYTFLHLHFEIHDMLRTYKQSRKLKVHEKDIDKFGKVPSLTTRLHKKYVW